LAFLANFLSSGSGDLNNQQIWFVCAPVKTFFLSQVGIQKIIEKYFQTYILLLFSNKQAPETLPLKEVIYLVLLTCHTMRVCTLRSKKCLTKL
tara:strand:- start:202920 stop:203198 length:279 start_codon:yes stop_codon:yes gene_type:complete